MEQEVAWKIIFYYFFWVGAWIDGWMDGWMDGQTDRWDGWINGENKTLKTKQEASENKQDLPVFVKQDII